jgi:hypothetical protein
MWAAAALTDRLLDQRPQPAGSALDQAMPGQAIAGSPSVPA